MNNLKRIFAKSLIEPSFANTIILSAAISSSVLIYGSNNEGYKFDNYSTPETITEVQELNSDLRAIETSFITAKEELKLAEQTEKTSNHPVSVIYADYNQDILNLNQDIRRFEYDLLSSGVSEQAIYDIVSTYNGIELSNLFPIINVDDIDQVNDSIKKIENKAILHQSEENREAYVNDVKRKSEPISVRDYMSLLALLYGFTAALSIGARVSISAALEDNQKLNKWANLDKKESKFLKNLLEKRKPDNKKLSAAAKGKNRLS